MRHRQPSIPQFMLAVVIILLSGCSASDYRWQVVFNDRREVSFRGIAVVSESVCWVSGSHGTVLRTTDGGANWQEFSIPGADTLDFRDIEAFGPDTAVVMSIGPGASSRIYRTVDGGRSWILAHRNRYEEGFYDAIAFWDDRRGILQGDPIENRLFILLTDDGGASWREIPREQMPEVAAGEYAFAASGSHLVTGWEREAWIGTGGARARVLHSNDYGETWRSSPTPMIHGIPSAGIFSLAFRDTLYGLATGGDYTRENSGRDNLINTDDGGISWNLQPGNPLDFRSSIRYADGIFVTVGPSGSEFSTDGGDSWSSIDGPGFHTLGIGANGIESVWAAGAESRIARLVGY